MGWLGAGLWPDQLFFCGPTARNKPAWGIAPGNGQQKKSLFSPDGAKQPPSTMARSESPGRRAKPTAICLPDHGAFPVSRPVGAKKSGWWAVTSPKGLPSAGLGRAFGPKRNTAERSPQLAHLDSGAEVGHAGAGVVLAEGENHRFLEGAAWDLGGDLVEAGFDVVRQGPFCGKA